MDDLEIRNAEEYIAAVAVPDEFSRRETIALLEIFLVRLGFGSVVLHVESVLACFGAGVSSACVVDIGAGKTRVCCVKEGTVIPQTKIAVPFGGRDIDKLLLWLCEKMGSSMFYDHHFGLVEVNMRNPQHAKEIERMKLQCCKFSQNLKEHPVEMQSFEVVLDLTESNSKVSLGQNLTKAALIAPWVNFEEFKASFFLLSSYWRTCFLLVHFSQWFADALC